MLNEISLREILVSAMHPGTLLRVVGRTLDNVARGIDGGLPNLLLSEGLVARIVQGLDIPNPQVYISAFSQINTAIIAADGLMEKVTPGFFGHKVLAYNNTALFNPIGLAFEQRLIEGGDEGVSSPGAMWNRLIFQDIATSNLVQFAEQTEVFSATGLISMYLRMTKAMQLERDLSPEEWEGHDNYLANATITNGVDLATLFVAHANNEDLYTYLGYLDLINQSIRQGMDILKYGRDLKKINPLTHQHHHQNVVIMSGEEPIIYYQQNLLPNVQSLAEFYDEYNQDIPNSLKIAFGMLGGVDSMIRNKFKIRQRM